MNSSRLRTPAGSSLAHEGKVLPFPSPTPRDRGEREARRRFAAARHKIGMTQLEASRALGVGTTTLEDWERGATRLPAWALVEIESRAASVKEAA